MRRHDQRQARGDKAYTATIAVIAKSPVAGTVKTRMCPPLTPEQACELARALLVDCLTTARAVGDRTVCVYTGAPQAIRAVTNGAVALLGQRGPDFSARLASAQADLFAGAGPDRVVLLGADCPTVDADYLRAAVQALDTAEVVLGPAMDGGYTLLAARRPTPELFDGVEMGTDRVLEQTLERARGRNTAVHLLDARHDIDTISELRAAERAGQLDHAGATKSVLAALPLTA